VLLLDGKTLQYDRPFSHDGVNYPANWLRLSSWDEKSAIGITEVSNSAQPAYDQKFYWGPNNPKDLDGLKTLWKQNTNETANKLLQQSDWYVVRKADNQTPIPAEWSTWRESIRTASSAKVLMIDLQTSVDDLASYIKTSTGAESDYNYWPADPDQPEPITETDDGVSSDAGTSDEVIFDSGTSSAGVVSGGFVSGGFGSGGATTMDYETDVITF